MNQTPAPSLNRLELTYYCTRLSKILFNISILFLISCVCGILSFISVALIMFVGFLIILATLGTIFIINPDFWNNLMSKDSLRLSLILQTQTLILSLTNLKTNHPLIALTQTLKLLKLQINI